MLSLFCRCFLINFVVSLGLLSLKLWNREIWVPWALPAKNNETWVYWFISWLQIPKSSTLPLVQRWIRSYKRQVIMLRGCLEVSPSHFGTYTVEMHIKGGVSSFWEAQKKIVSTTNQTNNFVNTCQMSFYVCVGKKIVLAHTPGCVCGGNLCTIPHNTIIPLSD